MSTRDTEAVSAMYEAFNRRDVDGWLAAFAPTATWHEIPTGEVFGVPDVSRMTRNVLQRFRDPQPLE
ncbi:MAG: hypothetical protein QOG77_2176 [Solirubrobacteraceae bacterium]|jgi:ketosteroid isomerase-like protein|nr:hypothetical protein [Solirubrobacteraceae bacterium]